MKALKHLFGGIDLTWPKVIVAAVIAGAYTAAMAIIPAVHNTSFHTIAVTFEVWILFGLIIVMNSKSNLDAALKSFVFFLISQPLVYLIQVPFSDLGWELFEFYPYWFVWTLLCLPMGYVGYWMKQDKWWGYLILLPLVLITARSLMQYSSEFLFSMPHYLLICIFCAAAMVLYPLGIFNDRRIRAVGAAIGGVLAAAALAVTLLNPPVYRTDILGSDGTFDGTYTAELADAKYGDVSIVYVESIETYMVHADFTRAGDTVLVLTSPSGEVTQYDVHIERDTYEVTKREAA